MRIGFNNNRNHLYRIIDSERIDSDSLDEVPLIADGQGEMDEEDYLMNQNRRRSCCSYFSDCWRRCCKLKIFKSNPYKPRSLRIGKPLLKGQRFPGNVVKNQKYNIFTFIPLVLYEQFKYFLNFYFLVMACSQLVPSIRVGELYTYWIPLTFVICITMVREAIDDFRRFCRDREVNHSRFKKLTPQGVVMVASADIKVGDLIIVEKNQRVPADAVLLRTTERQGSCFIRTDQMDGETDWKLRLAIPSLQNLSSETDLFNIDARVYAEEPKCDIHSFVGTFSMTNENGGGSIDHSLCLENTLWANTVVASGIAFGVVVYTGRETRSVMNTSQPHSKNGLLDKEVNNLTKLLFLSVVLLTVLMMIMKGFQGPWYRYMFRFVIVFSYLIPISLRVNLDMGKVFYSWTIQRDKKIPNTVVRSTTIPEELGRISYLLSDKTGTLTQNNMIFKKLHLGTVAFTNDTMDEVKAHLNTYFSQGMQGAAETATKGNIRKTVTVRVFEATKALALCHNVTPVYDSSESENSNVEADELDANTNITYQASSPDEVALVSWTEDVGLTLVKRDFKSMMLRSPNKGFHSFTILQLFPFTSETKRMGIIIREEESGEIIFYMKGADTVMQTIVQYNDWLEEECGNLAREGLRILVVAKKTLSAEVYADFEGRYQQAKMSVQDRNAKVSAVVESLERDMELLCVSGVEDKLQDGVRPTLELLKNAGIKIWMLTGDKLETAICIAKSSRLVAKTQLIHVFGNITSRAEAHNELNSSRRKNDHVLIISGSALEVCLKYYDNDFIEVACESPAVVVCRCSPTQKAEIVRLLRVHTKKLTCAIGDGGNDVSMIQAADAGIGIVGKEGRQASLAADFSITQFSHIGCLLLVHGRYSYKRSANLAQFIFHRGLIITTMQAIFSTIFYFSSVPIFPSLLMVGYSTIFTNFPVFSLVLDKDVSSDIAMTYPELYKELSKGRSLSYKIFFLWVLISIYQGGVLLFGALLLFEQEFRHIVVISYTALIFTELLMVGLTIHTWHVVMILCEILSLALYTIAILVLPKIFDHEFLQSPDFYWKVIVITSISCIPLYILKYLRKKFSPPIYSKLS